MAADDDDVAILIERIRMLVEANEAKDRYILQLEQQIDRDRHQPQFSDARDEMYDAVARAEKAEAALADAHEAIRQMTPFADRLAERDKRIEMLEMVIKSYQHE